MLPTIDETYLRTVLVELLNTPSPTGFAEQAIEKCAGWLTALPGVTVARTRKGGLSATVSGARQDAPVALTGHVDTLGAMVKEIKPSGRLKLTKLGGYAWQAAETEGVTVYTLDGRTVRGTILLAKSSSHVHGAAVAESKRDDDAMEVRLDAKTTSAAETHALGIAVGDFVVFDPRVEVGEAGFIRSRHLDDKAGVACMLAAVKAILDAGLQPVQRTTLHISNYEEVGHGASSGFPDDLAELLTVDMAALGDGQTSNEFVTTICVKDSGGPYHIDMTRKLVRLAEAHNIPYVRDIYPYYGSDGEAYWRAGGDVKVGLVGPGVDASHSYERTHMDSLIATTNLLIAYLLDA